MEGVAISAADETGLRFIYGAAMCGGAGLLWGDMQQISLKLSKIITPPMSHARYNI